MQMHVMAEFPEVAIDIREMKARGLEKPFLSDNAPCAGDEGQGAQVAVMGEVCAGAKEELRRETRHRRLWKLRVRHAARRGGSLVDKIELRMRKQADDVQGRRARSRLTMVERGVLVVAVDGQCYVLCSIQTM
jgi:hypothetical protein